MRKRERERERERERKKERDGVDGSGRGGKVVFKESGKTLY